MPRLCTDADLDPTGLAGFNAGFDPTPPPGATQEPVDERVTVVRWPLAFLASPFGLRLREAGPPRRGGRPRAAGSERSRRLGERMQTRWGSERVRLDKGRRV